MPINYERYPEDWAQISHRIRFERAGGRCENCGAEHLQPHPLFDYRVVLACCHRVHDLKNTSDDNLAAWCQTCHLNMDRAHHIASRRFGRYHRDGQLPIAPFPLLPLKPGIRYRRGTQLTLF